MPRLTLTVPDQVAQPYRFSLERQIVHFGRGNDNDIHIESGSVSLEHAVMERIIGGYVLKDLGSTNGIKLSGERVDRIHLRNGLEIHLGDVLFEFLLSDEEMTALRLEDPTSQLPSLNEPPSSKPSGPRSPEIELKSEPKPQPAPPQEEIRKLPELPPEPQPLPELSREPEPLPQLPPEPESQPPPRRQVRVEASAPQLNEAAAAPVDNSRFHKLVALLAVAAFLVGVAMHFQRGTGDSLFKAVMHKLAGEEAAK